MAADPCSFANVAELFTTHLHLDWKADFAQSKLIGSVTLDLTVTVDDITTVTLDSRGLTISSVALDGTSCAFEVKPETALGSAVVITTPALKKGQNFKLVVQYETSSDSAGIQWLEPSQTQDKKHPYLFTQFQAIHARSAIPCQDSPSVKTKYSATVTVPKELTALMSALSTGSTESGDSKTYTFDQPVPIPTYLIALAIGDLYSRDIGPRTRVWAEASVVEKAAWEFEETEQYLVTAEQILTPYEWGRYDVLCLPGSFPYGGMENPCLTFVTPTLLAGDRSLTHVVAHEITHSWTGNLVTNHTWQSFWLNEGFTVFVERKIIQRMFGAPSQHLGYINGWTDLMDSVEHFGRDHEFTTLDPKLDGIDPDDAFSSVPYERGANFLFFLERTVGGDAVFEPFLKEWINQNKFKTVTTEGFIKFFHDHFDPIVPKEKLAEIDWDAWLHQRGMPPVDMTQFYDQVLRERSVALADRWIKGDLEGFSSSDIEDFNTPQVVAFVERIMLEKPAGLPASTLEKIDSLYHFSEKKNSEIRAVWYTLALISNYEAVFPGVEEFLTEQGRMKFVRPLYRRLYSCEPNGKAKAVELFEKNKNIYHNIAKKMVQQDLIRLGASLSN